MWKNSNKSASSVTWAVAVACMTLVTAVAMDEVFANVFDEFNRSNSAQLGDGWVEKNPGAFSIVNEQVEKASTAEGFADNLVYRQTSEAVRDAEASVELRFLSTPLGYPQLFVRGQSGTITQPGSFDGYLLFVDNNPELALLDRIENGAFIQLSQIPISPALNTTDTYRLRLSAVGSDPVRLEANVERRVGESWEIIGQSVFNDAAATRIGSAGTVGFTGYVEGGVYSYDNFRRVNLDSVSSIVDFDNPPPPGSSGDLLQGEFEGIDFGAGSWRWDSSFAGNSTNQIYFNSSSGTSREIQFVGGARVLESVRVSSTTQGELTLSDDVGQTVTRTIAPGGVVNVQTSWTLASSEIDFDYTAGWEIGFDDIVTRSGGGGGENPFPIVSGVSPTSIAVGSAGLLLSVSGSGFVPESVVRWNGSDRQTSFTSPSQLQAEILESDLASTGTAVITVATPSPGGGVSAPRTVQVTGPVGDSFFDDFNRPNSANIGNGWTEKYPPAFAIQGGEVTNINTAPIDYHDAIVYRPVTEDQLNVEVGLEFRVLPGQSFPQVHARIQRDTITGNDQLHDYLFFVDGFEPDPGRAVIAIQPPTTDSQNYECYILGIPFPSQLRGQDRYRLRFQVQGTDPVVLTGSVDQLNGSAWQLFATGTTVHDDNTVRDPNLYCAPGAMPPPIRNSGAVGFAKWQTANEVLDNFFWSALGGGSSIPIVSNVSPDEVTAGTPGLSLTVEGSRFEAGSVVRWNGQNRPTMYRSSTRLEAEISEEDVASPGTATVTVRNPSPGGEVSNGIAVSIIGGGGGGGVVDFDQPTPPGGSFSLLNGEFEGLEFGVGQWRWEGPFGPDPSNHVFFASAQGTSRTLRFADAPSVLRSLNVFAGEAGTLMITDDTGQQRSLELTPGSLIPVETGWEDPAEVITIDFTGGWALGVDDIAWD